MENRISSMPFHHAPGTYRIPWSLSKSRDGEGAWKLSSWKVGSQSLIQFDIEKWTNMAFLILRNVEQNSFPLHMSFNYILGNNSSNNKTITSQLSPNFLFKRVLLEQLNTYLILKRKISSRSEDNLSYMSWKLHFWPGQAIISLRYLEGVTDL